MILGTWDIHMVVKINLKPYLTPYTKVHSRGITDLFMKVQTIKLSGEKK